MHSNDNNNIIIGRRGAIPISVPTNNDISVPGHQYDAIMAQVREMAEQQALLIRRIEQGEQQTQHVASQIHMVADSLDQTGHAPEEDSDDWDQPEAINKFYVSSIMIHLVNK